MRTAHLCSWDERFPANATLAPLEMIAIYTNNLGDEKDKSFLAVVRNTLWQD